MAAEIKTELLPSTDRIFGRLSDLVAIGPRRTGTPEGKAAANYVADTLRSFGIADVRIDESQSTKWEADEWDLVVDGTQVPCFPVTHSFIGENGLGEFSTGRDGYTARIVDLDSAADTDALAGAIVMFDVRFPGIDVAAELGPELAAWLPQDLFPGGKFTDPYHTTLPEIVPRLADAGVIGFIAVLSDYFDSNRYINEDVATIPVPGVWITRRDAERTRERLRSAPLAEATLTLHGRRVPATGYSPVAILPGRSSEAILVHSHHDSVWDGAVEDASGTAVVLALAEYFAAVPAPERARTLVFATMDTHFTGYEAHQKFVDKYIKHHDGGREILIDIAIEHVARAGHIVDGELEITDESELRLILYRAGDRIRDLIGEKAAELDRVLAVPTDLLPTSELPTDADFNHRAGLPVISFISAPIYLYDECDTLDKVDRNQLQPVTRMFAELTTELLSVPRTDFQP